MQAELTDVVVTVLKGWPHGRVRVSYGPYSTVCFPSDVWEVKQRLKELPIICPTCKRKATR